MGRERCPPSRYFSGHHRDSTVCGLSDTVCRCSWSQLAKEKRTLHRTHETLLYFELSPTPKRAGHLVGETMGTME